MPPSSTRVSCHVCWLVLKADCHSKHKQHGKHSLAQHRKAQHGAGQHITAQESAAQHRGLLLLQLLDSGLGVTVEMIAKDGQSNQLKRACLVLHLLLTHACKV